MRFRQKPPTEPGYYFALAKEYDELTIVRVRIESYGVMVDCPFDAGSECSEYGDPKDFVLWAGPIRIPAFKAPKYLLRAYHPRPNKSKPTAPCCRRWGHKWTEVPPHKHPTPTFDSPPEDGEDQIDHVYRNLIESMPACYERSHIKQRWKCDRCGEEKVRTFFDDYALAVMFGQPRLLDGMSSARTATEETK